MRRKIRSAIQIALPLLGMGTIFASVVFVSRDHLQSQVILVLIGILILEAGVWDLTKGLLPSERRDLALREEGDHFIELIRALNAAAIARNAGLEDDARFLDTQSQMHASVERMGKLASGGALAETAAEAAEVETGAAEVALAELGASEAD